MESFMRLFIIGNGFDIFHELKTKYSDYREALDETIVSKFEKMTSNSGMTKEATWRDIEAALGVCWNSLQSSFFSLYSNSFNDCIELETDMEQDFSFIFDFTGVLFYDFINKAQSKDAEPRFHFEKDDIFVNFNYTNTLERVYSISPERILHIHGMLDNIQPSGFLGSDILPSFNSIEEAEVSEPIVKAKYWNSDLVRSKIQFGAYPVFPYSGSITDDRTLHEIQRMHELFVKNPEQNMDKLQKFISEYHPEIIDEVIISGPSIGECDLPYFVKILMPTLKHSKWSFYCFSPKDMENYTSICAANGITPNWLKYSEV